MLIIRRRRNQSKKSIKDKDWWLEKLWIPIVIGIVLAFFSIIPKHLTEPKSGKLIIIADVDSAQVFLDGLILGQTKKDKAVTFKSIKLGTHILKIKSANYIPIKDSTISIDAGKVQSISFSFNDWIKKQREWLGEPFDPEKINILIADFTDAGGEVDEVGKEWAFKTFHELDKFMRSNEHLAQVVEMKRLYSGSTGIVIRDKNKAKEIGDQLSADIVLWGQNLCVGDSVCFYAKALLNTEPSTGSAYEEGVVARAQILRADLPSLIGARTKGFIFKFYNYANNSAKKCLPGKSVEP